MEELTKQQIVLVTLLVSFVTSIATGIVTVALMNQAPPGVTQTINRVVERTIEKAVPTTNQAAAVVTKETVVVKQDDLITQAIADNAKSLVALKSVSGEGDAKKETFLGNGLLVSTDGRIVSGGDVLASEHDANGSPVSVNYEATFPGGTVPLSVLGTDAKNKIVFFQPSANVSLKGKIKFTPASLGDSNELRLGQTVIGFGGEERTVGVGIVAALGSDAASVSASTTPASSSVTSVRAEVRPEVTTLGAILIDLSSDVVGLKTSSAPGASYLPINAVLSSLKTFTAATSTTSATP